MEMYQLIFWFSIKVFCYHYSFSL